MLLTVDVGNSTIVIGVFEGDQLTHHWRLSSSPKRTADELAAVLAGVLDLDGLRLARQMDGLIVGSVVPGVTETWQEIAERYLKVVPVFLEPGVRTGIALRHDNPRDLGADRIANAVAAQALYHGPAVVVDFGTAISFDVLDHDGNFIGGAIAPGVTTSRDGLVEHAARLPTVDIVAPRSPIGHSTVSALQAGLVYGFAGMVDGLVQQMIEELGPGVTAVATGGVAPAVLTACRTLDHHDPWLTLKGLRLIWERNTG